MAPNLVIAIVLSGETITLTPPARTMLLSPRRMLSTPNFTAKSDDEHAVFTAILVPARPSTYETRAGMMLASWPVAVCCSMPSGGRRLPYSCQNAPAKTEVSLPSSCRGTMPASSTASQATSRNSRCWGSISLASRGEMPKKLGSKPSICSRKPPHLVFILPGACGSRSRYLSTGQRFRGTSRIASMPLRRSFQKLAGESTPPGRRQPIPTMATGSWEGSGWVTSCTPLGELAPWASKCSTSRSTVGYCQGNVAQSVWPR